jgi:hypothetical protein
MWSIVAKRMSGVKEEAMVIGMSFSGWRPTISS